MLKGVNNSCIYICLNYNIKIVVVIYPQIICTFMGNLITTPRRVREMEEYKIKMPDWYFKHYDISRPKTPTSNKMCCCWWYKDDSEDYYYKPNTVFA